MKKCFTKVNNNYYKTLAISELNETKKEKQEDALKHTSCTFKSFSLLYSGFYTIDYQGFMIATHRNPPLFRR